MTDQKKIIVALVILFIVPSVLAVTYCDKSQINQNWVQGETPSTITLTCTNQDNSSATATKLGSYFSTSPSSPITLPSQTPRQIIISFDSNAPEGNNQGWITFSDSSSSVMINMTVEPGEVYDGDISFPSSKTFNVQQDKVYDKSLKLILPFNYPNSILIQTIDFSEETQILRWGDKEEGISVNPGDVFSIPLIIDTTDAQSGSYPPIDVIVRYDDNGINQLKSTVNIHISETINPIGLDTFSTPPSCSLSATSFNINKTYTFTCSGIVTNLNVEPEYNEYYYGTSREVTSGLYKYDITPTKYGETNFRAIFRYEGTPIFEAFDQEVRITSAGAQISGTDLKFLFTPSLENLNNNENVLIQLVDNKTGSLVSDPRIQVDARDINQTSPETFEFAFESEKSYILRGKALGYEDLTQTIKISPQNIEIIINPTAGDVSTKFNITTNPANTSLKINGVAFTNPHYGTLSGGINEIEASEEGYATNYVNITVTNYVRVLSGGADFKKGENQTFILNKNVTSIKIYYKKSADSKDREEYATGSGDEISFTPKKKGVYTLEADGRNVSSYTAEGFSFSNEWWFMSAWIWLSIGGFILLAVGAIIWKKSKSYIPDETSSVMEVCR